MQWDEPLDDYLQNSCKQVATDMQEAACQHNAST